MNVWTLLSAAAAAAAVLLSRPPPRWTVRHRLDLAAVWRLPRPRLLPVASAAALLTVVVVAVGASATFLAIGTLVGAGGFVVHLVRAQRSRAAELATRLEVGAALDLLAAELRGGVLADRALASAGEVAASLHDVARVAGAGGDVPAALRHAATRPGAEALTVLAAGWAVADRAGAPLADVVERMADTVRDDLELVREVASEAAPARATGRIMALLPVLGLGLGAGMGADPVHLLTQTLPGALCLAAGVALACLGTWWVDRIVASAEHQDAR